MLMKVYVVRCYYYRYNTGSGDNGSFHVDKSFNSVEEAEEIYDLLYRAHQSSIDRSYDKWYDAGSKFIYDETCDCGHVDGKPNLYHEYIMDDMVAPEKVFDIMGDLSDEEFPEDNVEDCLTKLINEVKENPTNIKGYSDCLLALFAAANKAGITFPELINSTYENLLNYQKKSRHKLSGGTY